MRRLLIAATYAAGGLALAAAVSFGAYAVTARQLSDPVEPVSVGSVAFQPASGLQGDDGGSADAPGSTEPDAWSPSWTPSSSPSPSDDPGGSDDGDDDSSGSGSGDDDDSSGPGSGDDGSGDDDDSSGSGSGDD